MSKKVQSQDVVPADLMRADEAPVRLQAEEVEPAIAPKLAANHNESVLE